MNPTGVPVVSQTHDVPIDNDRCKEHSLESLKAQALLYQPFSFGVIQVDFFLSLG